MQKRILISLTIIAAIAFLMAYYNQVIQANLLAPAVPYPKFINGVSPEPNSKVRFFSHLMSTFRSRINDIPSLGGVSASINPIELDTKENLIKEGDQIFSRYTDRTKLMIDEKEVPKDEFIAMSGLVGMQFLENDNIMSEKILDGGPYWMNWYPILLPGSHNAKIQIVNRAGEIKEYEWQFIVALW
jgi:hypothetical protein